WFAFLLAGCVIGTYWVRGLRAGTLPRTLSIGAAIGAVFAIGGLMLRPAGMPLFGFGDNQPVPYSPASFFYRTGVGLVGGGLAYLVTRRYGPGRFSPMAQLGRASLFVYWIHVELVYGHLSDPIKRRLDLRWSTLLIVILTLVMVALAWLRTERLADLRLI